MKEKEPRVLRIAWTEELKSQLVLYGVLHPWTNTRGLVVVAGAIWPTYLHHVSKRPENGRPIPQ